MPQTHSQAAAINAETDARFWSGCGYKPGQKLDMSNQFDRMWVDAWNAYHQQVMREVANGTIRWTYNTPAVADMLAKAHQASAAAAQSIANAQAAKASGDHAGAQGHLDDAHAAIGTAQVATAAAATAMPPPPADAHPATAAAAQGTHEVLSFTMNGAGQGQLTGVTGGSAPVPVIMPADQVGAVQATLAPTRMGPSDADSGTLPGGRGHNALIIAGVCAAGLGAVALVSTLGKKSAGRTMRIARARAR